jgi:ferritin
MNNDQEVKLLPVAAPDKRYADPGGPLKAALAHEKFVTASIHAIYDAAYAAKDFRTMEFLNWFVKEQGEEEKNALNLMDQYELFGKDARGLYLLNQELAARSYAAPSLVLD